MDSLSEINITMEKLRRRVEYFEENPDNQIKEWEECLDQLTILFKEVVRQQVFSKNEEFEELKTEDIKFLLIPFYQADMVQKFMEMLVMLSLSKSNLLCPVYHFK